MVTVGHIPFTGLLSLTTFLPAQTESDQSLTTTPLLRDTPTTTPVPLLRPTNLPSRRCNTTSLRLRHRRREDTRYRAEDRRGGIRSMRSALRCTANGERWKDAFHGRREGAPQRTEKQRIGSVGRRRSHLVSCASQIPPFVPCHQRPSCLPGLRCGRRRGCGTSVDKGVCGISTARGDVVEIAPDSKLRPFKLSSTSNFHVEALDSTLAYLQGSEGHDSSTWSSSLASLRLSSVWEQVDAVRRFTVRRFDLSNASLPLTPARQDCAVDPGPPCSSG